MKSQIKKVLDTILTSVERSPAFYVWISILVALIALAAYAFLMSLIHSMEILEFSVTVPWTMLVSNYVFFVGSSRAS